MTMSPSTTTGLSDIQKRAYEENGYLCPLRVFDTDETRHFLSVYLAYAERNRGRLESMTPRERYQVFSETHFVLPWVYKMVTHPRILDAVEGILGPNFLAWNTNWFTKTVGDKTFVSWHQDGTYWKLSLAKVVTAWVALTPSQPITGCMRIVPGTHLKPAMPQRETADKNNALSRGQEIAVEVDEKHAIDLALLPGEMSLHNIWIVHGSNPNLSPDTPRIGLAIRYVSTEVHQESPSKPLAILVRGRDTYGHFELLPAPEEKGEEDVTQRHIEIVRRIRASLMEEAKTPTPK
jgi:ectoine hydroxylase-related dioxygenase (phytanoyl-CoA dioxygenase family)